MGTRPTKPGPWPYAQKRRAKLVAERAGHAIKHLDQARNSLDTRAHPAIVALDIADAQRILSDTVTEMRAALSGE